MKEWFKYEYGYVNIDSENLYLTNSGNWSETKDLIEKTKQTVKQADKRSSSAIGFIIAALCLFAFLILKSMISGKLGLAFIVLTVALGYKLYDYLKTEIGAKFKIPLDKISAITETGNSIEIIFINGEGNQDSCKLHRVDEKGIAVMNSLKQYIA